MHSLHLKMLEAVFTIRTEGAPLKCSCPHEGGHPSFCDPGIEGSLEVDYPDARSHSLPVSESKSSSESFSSMPNVNRHFPSFKAISDPEVYFLGDFRRAFLSFQEYMDLFLQAFCMGEHFLSTFHYYR